MINAEADKKYKKGGDGWEEKPSLTLQATDQQDAHGNTKKWDQDMAKAIAKRDHGIGNF